MRLLPQIKLMFLFFTLSSPGFVAIYAGRSLPLATTHERGLCFLRSGFRRKCHSQSFLNVSPACLPNTRVLILNSCGRSLFFKGRALYSGSMLCCNTEMYKRFL